MTRLTLKKDTLFFFVKIRNLGHPSLENKFLQRYVSSNVFLVNRSWVAPFAVDQFWSATLGQKGRKTLRPFGLCEKFSQKTNR